MTSGLIETPAAAWDNIAANYAKNVAPGEAEVAQTGLRLAGLEAGQLFLDVAAGTGGLSLPAARLGARVLATDWAPSMLEHFNTRVAAEGLDAEGRVMNCHALDLADNEFDVTGSQFGVMLVPDQAKALDEMVRVTKPGGHVLLIGYGDPDQFEALHFFMAAVNAVAPQLGGPEEEGEPPLEFQAADPEVLRQRLTEAGLADVTVDTVNQERIVVRTGRQLWDWCLSSNPLPGTLVADLTDEQREDVIRVLDGMVRERSGGKVAATLTAPLNIAVGTKPPR